MKKSEMKRELMNIAEKGMVFNAIHWFPNRKKHDSGYQRRTIIGENKDGLFFICDFCDDLAFMHEDKNVDYWSDFRIDTPMNGINRIWSNAFKFKLRYNGSSTDFIFVK